jgi:hypothetical protein
VYVQNTFVFVRSKYVQSCIYIYIDNILSQLVDVCCSFNVIIFIFYVANNGAENGERQFAWKELVVAYLKTVLRTFRA